jgi:hypothetical protein
MKRFLDALFVCAFCFSTARTFAEPIAVAGVKKDSNGVTLQMNPGAMRLEVYSPRIIRVTYTAQDQLPRSASLAVIAKPERVKWKLSDTKSEIILRTDEIQACVNRATGAVSFFDKDGAPILAENPELRKIQTPANADSVVLARVAGVTSARDGGTPIGPADSVVMDANNPYVG